MISIHTPAWGATDYGFKVYIGTEFQSTLPRGERQLAIAVCQLFSQFQSTLPRGERPEYSGNLISIS